MSAGQTILVVEDDRVMRETLAKHLRSSHRIITAGTCGEARTAFAKARVALVILDINLPDGEGLALVEQFRQDGHAEVVIITAYPKAQSAVRALKSGAFDYINKPFDLDEFEIVVGKALEVQRLRNEVAALRRERHEAGGVDKIIGEAPSIARLREEILQVAGAPSTVLIRGESGTGKELVAEAVHRESPRRKGPLVRLNCSAIPATLIESELFGHERGAFTDAKTAREGLVEFANGGTLFLDEIGDLPLDLQPKLLRVLESRCFRRIGANREIEVDVRFVAATNRDLQELVAAGKFREDLLFRLKVFEIVVPPLRDRRSDVPVLARAFLADLARRFDKPLRDFDSDAMQDLYAYSWPGNVRELHNVIERAVILAKGEQVTRADLPTDLNPDLPRQCIDSCPAFPEGLSTLAPLADIEQQYILCVYRRFECNKTRAAEALGISRVTLREKLKQYDFDDES